MQYTVSARGKQAAQPIQQFIKQNYSDIPLEEINSFFGFAEASTLYGGRFFGGTELSRYDIRSMYKMGINLRLPLTNHLAYAGGVRRKPCRSWKNTIAPEIP